MKYFTLVLLAFGLVVIAQSSIHSSEARKDCTGPDCRVVPVENMR